MFFYLFLFFYPYRFTIAIILAITILLNFSLIFPTEAFAMISDSDPDQIDESMPPCYSENIYDRYGDKYEEYSITGDSYWEADTDQAKHSKFSTYYYNLKSKFKEFKNDFKRIFSSKKGPSK